MKKFDELYNKTKKVLSEAVESNTLKDLIKQITLGKNQHLPYTIQRILKDIDARKSDR